MATEYVKSPFLNAKGKMVVVGAKAPDEPEENLQAYRKMGLIGAVVKPVPTPSPDTERPAKAAPRKPAAKSAK